MFVSRKASVTDTIMFIGLKQSKNLTKSHFVRLTSAYGYEIGGTVRHKTQYFSFKPNGYCHEVLLVHSAY